MISQSLLPEYDMEMANTRKTLERVPNDKLGWKPHDKSMSMGQLAIHLAELAAWGGDTMKSDSFDVAGYQPANIDSSQKIVGAFDKNVAATRAALSATSDADFMKTWTLKNGTETIFAMPRVAVFRGMIMNHIIHHRAQLGVYLRLNNLPVPALYGPSADEQQ
jgi:uncharacterized damage-inducible protein DinB